MTKERQYKLLRACSRNNWGFTVRHAHGRFFRIPGLGLRGRYKR